MTMTMTFWQWFIVVYWFDANDLMLFSFKPLQLTTDDTNVFFTFSVTGLK